MGPLMTPSDLAQVGEALYGQRWQSELARELGVAVRTVQRWMDSTRAIPAGLPYELLKPLVTRWLTIDELITRLQQLQRAAVNAASVESPVARASQNR